MNPPFQAYISRAVVVDATFFGRRRDKFGVLVCKDSITKEILIWKHIELEKIKDYVYLKDELIAMEFSINVLKLP